MATMTSAASSIRWHAGLSNAFAQTQVGLAAPQIVWTTFRRNGSSAGVAALAAPARSRMRRRRFAVLVRASTVTSLLIGWDIFAGPVRQFEIHVPLAALWFLG